MQLRLRPRRFHLGLRGNVGASSFHREIVRMLCVPNMIAPHVAGSSLGSKWKHTKNSPLKPPGGGVATQKLQQTFVPGIHV